MKKITYTSVTILLLLLFCINLYKYIINPWLKNNLELNETNEIVYDNFTTKIDDLNVLLSNELTGIIYFGRDSCPACLKINEILAQAYVYDESLIVYKIDTEYWRDIKEYKLVIDKYNVVEVPLLAKIDCDGNLIDTFTIDEDSMDDIQKELFMFLKIS